MKYDNSFLQAALISRRRCLALLRIASELVKFELDYGEHTGKSPIDEPFRGETAATCKRSGVSTSWSALENMPATPCTTGGRWVAQIAEEWVSQPGAWIAFLLLYQDLNNIEAELTSNSRTN